MKTVYGQRLTKRDPIINSFNKEIIDNGENTKIRLGSFTDEKAACFFEKNIKANTKRHVWKIWSE